MEPDERGPFDHWAEEAKPASPLNRPLWMVAVFIWLLVLLVMIFRSQNF